MKRQPRSLYLSLALAACLATWLAAVNAQSTLRVPAGGDLQGAIDRAQPGDLILLDPGATYTGNFRLREKAGSRHITIRSAADPSRFPANGRVGPEHARWMPTLKSPNNSPALATDARASHWRLQWLAFAANSRGLGDIIVLGHGGAAQRDLAVVPGDLTLDGLIITGDPQFGQKRGIALNSGSTVIRNSDIRGIRAPGQDSQAICGWNGPGPYLIENNHLEAAGENIMFGGADPSIRDLVPSDITVRGNYVTKPLEWREERGWTVKNLFELKNARRVLVEGNLFEHNWLAAQTGYAILFTVRNEEGRAPWSVVEDVTFQHNVVRHVASAINILGHDNLHPSQQARGIQVRHNLFYGVDGSKWGGEGRFLMIGDAPADVLIDHNTIVQTGTIVLAYGKHAGQPRPIPRFTFTNNLTFHNEYGILGEDHGIGEHSIRAYFADGDIRANVIAGGDARRYPGGNFFPSPQELLGQFVDPAANDYRLKPDSRFRDSSSEGGALGADIEGLLRRVPLDRTRTGAPRPGRTAR